MSGGGKGGGSQKINTDPWKPAQPYILEGMQGAQDLYQNGPGFYTPQNSDQITGQNMAKGYADNFGSLYSPYVQSSQAGLAGMGANAGTNSSLQASTMGMGANPYSNTALTQGLGGGAANPFANRSLNQGLMGMASNPYANQSMQQGLMGMGGNAAANQAMAYQLGGPNVNNNPALDAYANAATRPLEQQLNMSTLPGIRSQYGGAGQYGSSRQGISEGVARGLTNQAIGDTRANIYSNAYGQGLGAQSSALGQSLAQQQGTLGQSLGAQQNSVGQSLGSQNYSLGQSMGAQQTGTGQSLDAQARAQALYPQMLQAGMTPSNIYSQVGAANQADQNAQQIDPYNQLAAYQGAINGNMGSTQSQSGSSSALMNALGGGATGMGLGSLMGAGGIGSLGWGGIGGILGALGGLFG